MFLKIWENFTYKNKYDAYKNKYDTYKNKYGSTIKYQLNQK